jgi:hypothetical protein
MPYRVPYRVVKEAEPQFKLLLVATVVSIALWIISWYLPMVGLVVYPLQLFATFIHEGAHVLATLLTGNSVQSLTVSSDGSGAVWSQGAGALSQLLISSAGYLGTTLYGAGLLAWMRFGYSSKVALYISAGFVIAMSVVFGLLAPFFSFFSTVTLGSVFFTVFAGFVLAALLSAVAHFASTKWANFALAFLAVQCLLNAVFSLVDLLFITAMTSGHSDAVNMSAATGIPAIVWVLIWFGISILLISAGLRIYSVSKRSKADTVFED